MNMTARTLIILLLLVFPQSIPASKSAEEGAGQEQNPLDKKASVLAVMALQGYLKLERDERSKLSTVKFARVPLTKGDSQRCQQLLWLDHVAMIRETRAAEMKAKVLTTGKLKMPFDFKIFGTKPKSGRSLYISLHGGGGAPKAVNDRQWQNQKGLYSPKEGVYLAPRAPTNTWNLWHQGHIDGLFDRLIENLIVFEDVDPDRVYLMGYSAGGDGVYQLAPRMADRLAAAAMMAGHPNETSPLGLRNLPFAIHVGEKDSAYSRNRVAKQWKHKLADLRKADAAGYLHYVRIHAGRGHWMNREDAVAVEWMAKFKRHALPKRIVWMQDDVTHSRFYWLAVVDTNKKARARINATRDAQHFSVESKDVKSVIIRLNDQMADLDQPIKVEANGESVFEARVERTISTLASTLAERGDPRLVFSAKVEVQLK